MFEGCLGICRPGIGQIDLRADAGGLTAEEMYGVWERSERKSEAFRSYLEGLGRVCCVLHTLPATQGRKQIDEAFREI